MIPIPNPTHQLSLSKVCQLTRKLDKQQHHLESCFLSPDLRLGNIPFYGHLELHLRSGVGLERSCSGRLTIRQLIMVSYLEGKADDGIEESSIHVRATILRIGLDVSVYNIQVMWGRTRSQAPHVASGLYPEVGS